MRTRDMAVKLNWLGGYLLALAACGSGSDGLGPIEDFVVEAQQVTCENLAACRLMPDVDSCLATTFPERSGTLKTVAAAVQAGRIAFDPKAGAACLEAIRARPCTWTAVLRDIDVCRAVLTGQVPAGEACVINDECVTGGCDRPSGGGICSVGVCARIVQDGDSCGPDTPTVCREGSYCEFGTTGGYICKKYALVGMGCGAGQSCLRGLVCENDVCAERPGAGEACVLHCDPTDTHCDATSLVCVPDRAAGEVCDSNPQCNEFAFCDQVCTTQRSEGGACEPFQFQCLGDLACQDNTCIVPDDQSACSLP